LDFETVQKGVFFFASFKKTSPLCEIMRSSLWFWIIDVEGNTISVLSPLLVLLLDKTGIPREKQVTKRVTSVAY
jgi:hypothetical protein